MKITFLIPQPDTSGGARVIATYARRLCDRGHHVRIVAAGKRPPTMRERLALLRPRSHNVDLGLAHYRAVGDLLSYGSQPGCITADDCPDADVIIATWWRTAEWMSAMPSAKGKQFHFVQHYEAFPNMPKERVDAVLRLATAKITISGWLKGLLVDDFGNDVVALVPNGVDTEQFHAPPRAVSATPKVGMMYSRTRWKNSRGGIAAFERLRETVPRADFITFGHDPEMSDMPLPTGTRHNVLPAQDQIKDIYAACDVWLCSSFEEGFGLPVLEAMACRCPVVSTPVGGPLDFIVDGVNGYVTSSFGEEVIADRLHAVLTKTPVAWKAMSDAAHATAQSMTWDHATAQFESALEGYSAC